MARRVTGGCPRVIAARGGVLLYTIRAHGRWTLLWAGFLAWAGCEDAQPGEAGLHQAPWLVFQEVRSLGGSHARGPDAFGSIRAAALLAGGDRLVVADAQTQALQVFDLAGRHLMSIGGRGGGPAEHQAVHAIWGTEDGGFCTWDQQTARVARFDREGQVVTSALAKLDGLESIRPTFEGFFDDCHFVLRDQPSTLQMRDVPQGMRRDTVRFLLFGSLGEPVRTLADVPGAEHWFRNTGENWGPVQLIFGEQLLGTPQSGQFWFGLTDRPAWERVTLEGRVLESRQLAYSVRPASDAEIQSERERRIAEVRVPRVALPIGPPDFVDRMEESQREGLRTVAARSRVPSHDQIVPRVDGGVWFREHPLPSDSMSTWHLVDSAGVHIGRIALSREAELLSGSAETLLIRTEDELGAHVLLILRVAS